MTNSPRAAGPWGTRRTTPCPHQLFVSLPIKNLERSVAFFNGEPPAGDRKVCPVDGDDKDAGKLQTATLTVLAWQQ